MQTGTWFMMALILGIVWGGFALLLWRSVVVDRRKAQREEGE